ncbi:MAG: lamin tail domain-containing protein [Bacteroidales bacterium]|nr:lamin tail domain-containing protein [Bacteroidales bacterium]
MHNGSVGNSGDPISIWETTNRFENDTLTMSGTGDLRNTNASTYANASGSWNVMLNSIGENFLIQGIDAGSFSGLTLKLGIRKASNSEDGSGILIESSNDSVSWFPLTISLPTGTGTAGWHEVTASGIVQPGPQLYIRFTSQNAQDFRLDDIRLIGIPPCPISISSFQPANGPIGTEILIHGSGLGTVSAIHFCDTIPATFTILSDTILITRVPEISSYCSIELIGTCTVFSSSPFLVLSSSCSLNGSNLIISELCDPVENFQTDRFIEIYNPTASPIDLSDWTLKAIANYTECETWVLSGSIEPGEAKTCGFPNPVSGGPHDFTNLSWNGNIFGSCCSFWNGNHRDGAVLYYNEVKIDQVLYGNDLLPWFNDRSLARSDTACHPNPAGGSDGWQPTTIVNNAGLNPASPGIHSSNCYGNPPETGTNPADQEACAGEEVMLVTSASDESQVYGFEWWVCQDYGSWTVVNSGINYSIINTAVSSSLYINGLNTDIQFYCRIYSYNGGCWRASEAAQIKFLQLPLTSAVFHF